MGEYTSRIFPCLKKGQLHAQAWWEDLGQRGVTMGKDFCPAAWIFQVKNRFHKDYRDKHELEHETGNSFAKVWEHIGKAGKAGEGE